MNNKYLYMFYLDPHDFIHEIYKVFLKRDVDHNALMFYLAQLKEGASKEQVFYDIYFSNEHKGKMGKYDVNFIRERYWFYFKKKLGSNFVSKKINKFIFAIDNSAHIHQEISEKISNLMNVNRDINVSVDLSKTSAQSALNYKVQNKMLQSLLNNEDRVSRLPSKAIIHLFKAANLG
ncbi:DUF4214 domain-containing protein [Acinetobacter brisouii]|uniref:DUF4214 domain-containing protein n=1 Tax=Acinetobacter brisouii TaxID=396323 RepID=UPI00124C091A|nr:DUF4214 domain-containing protein [Acinetobacter brisouii]